MNKIVKPINKIDEKNVLLIYMLKSISRYICGSIDDDN